MFLVGNIIWLGLKEKIMPHEQLMDNVADRDKIKRAKFLIWTGFLVYVLMMGSKNVYTAEVAAIQLAFGTGKAQTSLAMTYYFIAYAIGQLVLAPLFSKTNLKVFISLTAGVSSVLTVLIGFMPSMTMLYVLCTINGALQAGIYSGVMAIISKYAPTKLLPYANRVMSAGGAIYGILSYGVPAIFVGFGLWNVPFILLGIVFGIIVIIFFIAAERMKKYPPEIDWQNGKCKSVENEPMYINVSTRSKKIRYFVLMALLSLFGNFMHGLLQQWVPSLLHEKFGMDLSYSILITLLVPLGLFAGSLVAVSLCEKYKNVFNVSMVVTAIAMIVFAPMIFFYDANIVLTIVCVVGFLSISNAGRVTFSSILSFKMRSHINTGSYLAFLNAFSAVVQAVAPPTGGAIIDSIGYGKLFVLIVAIGVVFMCLLFACSRMVNNARDKDKLN